MIRISFTYHRCEYEPESLRIFVYISRRLCVRRPPSHAYPPAAKAPVLILASRLFLFGGVSKDTMNSVRANPKPAGRFGSSPQPRSEEMGLDGATGKCVQRGSIYSHGWALPRYLSCPYRRQPAKLPRPTPCLLLPVDCCHKDCGCSMAMQGKLHGKVSVVKSHYGKGRPSKKKRPTRTHTPRILRLHIYTT